MRQITKFLLLTVLGASVLFRSAGTANAEPSSAAAVQNEEASLREDSSAADYISFVVKMKEESPQDKREDMIEGAESVVEDLMETADRSQGDIIAYLEAEKAKGSVESYQSFFIVNSISVNAKKEVLLALEQRSDVEKIVADRMIKEEVPEDNEEESGFSLRSVQAQKHIPWNIRSILADKVWQYEKITGEGVVVGIIDSGVDAQHPAIANAWRGNTPGMEVYSWYDTTDRSNRGRGSKPTDSTGHGTHVAGTILGQDPSTASAMGVAPGAKWIAAKVFDEEGETSLTRLLEAGQWMLAPTDEHGVPHPEMAPKIVNNSWGGNSQDEFFRDILKEWRRAGILPVFSAGNTGPANQGGEGSIGTPGSYPEAFTVGALKRDDTIAAFSLRGPSKYKGDIKPDICAPGVNIRSSVPGGAYALRTGTSMAGPHVSGVAALILEADPTMSVDEIEKTITESASPLTDTYYVKSPNFGYGYGKINAYTAVKMAKHKDEPQQDTGKLSGRILKAGSDASDPGIEHHQIRTMYNVYSFDIEAGVRDDQGIEKVSLFLAKKDTEEWVEKEMELREGSKVDGSYACNIRPDELDLGGMKYYIEAEDISKKKLKTPTYEVAVKSGIGIGYTQDFETDVDGFVFGGKTPMWEWGKPQSGPNAAVSGEKLVGTNLEGSYKDLKDTLLILPAIDLSAESQNAALTFKHWYELGNGEGAFFDTAEVWVGEITDPDMGIDDVQYKNLRLFRNRSREWKDEYIDLSAYKGKKILVMLGMRYGGWSKRAEAGWYIDDIRLVKTSDEVPPAPSADISMRFSNEGRILYDFTPIKNEKITAYALYRSREKDGEYELVEKVEKGSPDFGNYSIKLIDYPKPQSGTYYYCAKAFIGDNISEASQILSHTFTTGEEVLKYDFEDGDQGWSSEPDEKGAVWTRGVIEVENPLPDHKIGSAPTPNVSKGKNENSPNVWATELNDFRKPKRVYTLISPRMDLSKVSKGKLYLQMWYNTTGKKESGEWGNFDDDRGEVWFSKDAGASWEQVFSLDDTTVYSGTRSKGAWCLDGYALPEGYNTDQFMVKFILKSGSDISGSTCGGWYIDDVMIYDEEAAGGIISPDMIEGKGESPESFELNNLEFHPMHEAAQTSLVPVVGRVTIEETGVSALSEAGSGKYSLKHGSGSYTMLVEAEGYAPKRIAVEIKAGETTQQDIVLEDIQKSEMILNVKDKQKQILSESLVQLFRKEEGDAAYSAQGGELHLNDLYPGEYELIIKSKGFKTRKERILLEAGKILDLGTIYMERLEEKAESAEEELFYDDGEAESIIAYMADKKSVGVRFEVAEESRIKKLRFMFVKAAGNTSGTAGKEFSYSIYDQNDEDGYPGRLLGGPFTARVDAEGSWTEVELPEEVQVKGEFFVAYTQIGEGDGTPQIGVDDDSPGLGKSFKMINRAWNEASESGTFMIRSVIEPIFILDEAEPNEEEKEPNKPEEPKKPEEEPEKSEEPNQGEGEKKEKPNTEVPEIKDQGSETEREDQRWRREHRPNPEDEKHRDIPTFTEDYKSLMPGRDGDWEVLGGDQPEIIFRKNNGERLKGWQKISSYKEQRTQTEDYYFNEEGVLQSGWLYDANSGKWYYLSEKKDESFGTMQRGWFYDQNGEYYYLDMKEGYMYTGMRMIEGKVYLFNSSAAASLRGEQSAPWFFSDQEKKPYGALIK
ncbi:MAG: S8 family serine peptidase [Johnsonella sp.]|nr:S8 family serine peptidase [Johnsonella sp.]